MVTAVAISLVHQLLDLCVWVCVIIVSSLSNLVRNTFPDCCDVSDFKVFKVSVVMTTTPERERERKKRIFLKKKNAVFHRNSRLCIKKEIKAR